MEHQNITNTKVRINCPNCGSIVEDELDSWPSPDMSADTASESSDCIGGTLVCEKCKKEIDYSISADFNGDVICVPSNLEIIDE